MRQNNSHKLPEPGLELYDDTYLVDLITDAADVLASREWNVTYKLTRPEQP